MPTKNTHIISARIKDELYYRIQYFAKKKGKSISEWITPILERAASAGKRIR